MCVNLRITNLAEEKEESHKTFAKKSIFAKNKKRDLILISSKRLILQIPSLFFTCKDSSISLLESNSQLSYFYFFLVARNRKVQQFPVY